MALTQISTAGVKDDAVTAGKIPANAVGSSELADNAVDTAAIAADAVTNAKIADNAIENSQLANGEITAAKLASNSVTAAKIANDAVGAEHIEVLDAALQFGDSVKAQFGTGNDLELYHDGGDTHIDNHTGHLRIRNGAAGNILLEPRDGEPGIYSKLDGATELYYNGSKKLETTNSGVEVFGELQMDDANSHLKLPDNARIDVGASNDLQIYHDAGAASHINATGLLNIDGTTGVRLEHNNATKLQTTSSGVSVTGGLDADDNISINDGSNADLRLQTSANNRLIIRGSSSNSSIITQNNGNLLLKHDGGTGSGTQIAAVNSNGLDIGNNKRIQIADYYGDISGKIENDSSSANALKIEADPNNSGSGSYIALKVDGTEQVRIADGIAFNGDTATANFLNDYETGTYTPKISGSGGWEASHSVQNGNYVKIGNMCFVHIRITTSAMSGISGSSYLRVSLPFTSVNTSDTVGTLHCSEWSTGTQDISWLGGNVGSNYAFADLHYHNGNNNNTNRPTKGNFSNQVQFRGTVTYRTA